VAKSTGAWLGALLSGMASGLAPGFGLRAFGFTPPSPEVRSTSSRAFTAEGAGSQRKHKEVKWRATNGNSLKWRQDSRFLRRLWPVRNDKDFGTILRYAESLRLEASGFSIDVRIWRGC
jgi:hypothetical protein